MYLLAFVYQQIEWHILPLIPFSTINNISIWVKRINFTFVFFKAACHTNPCAVRKWAWSSPYILRQDTYFESSQIQQLTIMYHCEYSNILGYKDIERYSLKFFISKFLQTLFACE